MSYDIRGHVLLSATAAALDPDVLRAWGQVAEDALGLTGTGYTGNRAQRAAHAVVLQVNWMAVQPADPTLTSHTMGDISKGWTPRSGLAAVDPLAAEIVATLAAEAAAETTEGEYITVTSFR